MTLRSATENETGERFLASARNDNACHLERSERSFSSPIFEGDTKGTTDSGREIHESPYVVYFAIFVVKKFLPNGGALVGERP